jgi:O-antigen/teichoic acid export membrane protein
LIKRIKSKLNQDLSFKEILKGSSISFLLSMIGMLIGYILTIVISKKYGAEGMGIYNLTFNIMSFLGMIAMYGMNISVLRYVGEFNQKKEFNKLASLYQNILKITLPTALFLSIIIFFSAEIIAEKILNNINYINPIKLISFTLPFFVLLEINIEFIRGINKLKISETLRNISRPLINTIFLFLVSYFIVDNMLPLYGLSLAIFISSIIGTLFVIKKLSFIEISNEKNLLTKKKIFKTSFPMMGTAVISFFMATLPLFALQIYSTTADVGIFSVALKISLLIGLVLTVTNTVVAPKFSGLYWSDKKNELQEMVTKSTKLNIFLSAILLLIIFLFSNNILHVFGEEFTEGKYILIILAIGQFFNVSTGSAGVLLNMCGLQKEAQKIIIYSLILTVLLHIILVPLYNLEGAAISFLLTTIFMRTYNVYTVKRLLNINTINITFIGKTQ